MSVKMHWPSPSVMSPDVASVQIIHGLSMKPAGLNSEYARMVFAVASWIQFPSRAMVSAMSATLTSTTLSARPGRGNGMVTTSPGSLILSEL